MPDTITPPITTTVTPPVAPSGMPDAEVQQLRASAESLKTLTADLKAMNQGDQAAARRVLVAQGITNEDEINAHLASAFGPGDDDEDADGEDEDPVHGDARRASRSRPRGGKKPTPTVDEEARGELAKTQAQMAAMAQERLDDIRARRDDIIDTGMDTMPEIKSLLHGLDPTDDKETIDSRLTTVRERAVALFGQKSAEKYKSAGNRWNPGWIRPLAQEALKESAAVLLKTIGRPKHLGRGPVGSALEGGGRQKVEIPKIERGQALAGGQVEAMVQALFSRGLEEAEADNQLI